jgi:hypothetical protein
LPHPPIGHVVDLDFFNKNDKLSLSM